jgi:endoglucanase
MMTKLGVTIGLTSLTLGLLTGGCLKPPPGTTPGPAPGSAASIGGGAAAPAGGDTAAAAPAGAGPSAPITAGAPIGSTGLKDCGQVGMIDDGEDGNNQNMPEGNRGGYWYTFRDQKGTTIEPVAGTDGGTFAMSEGGKSSQFAARFHGKIGTGAPLFGGMGMNFIDPKAPYDASQYAGISFWAKKGDNSVAKVRLKVPDANTDPDGGVCAECFNDFGGDLTLTNEWKQYIFPWKSMKQMPGWGNPRKPHVTPSKIYGIQFQVNVPSANYDIYVDDLKFVCQ